MATVRCESKTTASTVCGYSALAAVLRAFAPERPEKEEISRIYNRGRGLAALGNMARKTEGKKVREETRIRVTGARNSMEPQTEPMSCRKGKTKRGGTIDHE